MDRADIEQRIAELDEDPGWYQNIDLGDGIQTKTRVIWGEDIDHPRRRWGGVEPAVPIDLRGVSVLDIVTRTLVGG